MGTDITDAAKFQSSYTQIKISILFVQLSQSLCCFSLPFVHFESAMLLESAGWFLKSPNAHVFCFWAHRVR